MAQKKILPGSQEPPQQEEMTVVVFKFKGGAESMQKGFEAVNNAIAALGPTQGNSHRVVAQRISAPPAASPEQNDQIIDAKVEESNHNGSNESEAVAHTPLAPKAKRSQSSPKYTFMSDFNLSPDGVPSLTEYCTEKEPQTIDEKFLVASAWIQTHGGVNPFTGGHLFTAFRAMEWKIQVDMTQPIRKLKSDKSYYENPITGKWKLTGIGLTAAENISKK